MWLTHGLVDLRILLQFQPDISDLLYSLESTIFKELFIPGDLERS